MFENAFICYYCGVNLAFICVVAVLYWFEVIWVILVKLFLVGNVCVSFFGGLSGLYIGYFL